MSATRAHRKKKRRRHPKRPSFPEGCGVGSAPTLLQDGRGGVLCDLVPLKSPRGFGVMCRFPQHDMTQVALLRHDGSVRRWKLGYCARDFRKAARTAIQLILSASEEEGAASARDEPAHKEPVT